MVAGHDEVKVVFGDPVASGHKDGEGASCLYENALCTNCEHKTKVGGFYIMNSVQK